MAGTAPAASASAAPAAPAAAPAGAIPKTAHVAVLTEKEHFDIKEYPIPAIGDDDILVKVEGCGVCGTDAHESRETQFNLIPVALGHEELVRSLPWVKMLRLIQLENRLRSVTKSLPV